MIALSSILAWIAAAAGAAAGITTILKFGKAPVEFFQKVKEKKEERHKQKTIQYCEKEIPRLIEDYQKVNYLEWVKDISHITIEALTPLLEEIRDINKQQSLAIEKLNKSSTDLLRQRISTIYFRYKEMKKIPRRLKEELDELYEDYTEQGGNHHVNKWKIRWDLWEIVDTEDDY